MIRLLAAALLLAAAAVPAFACEYNKSVSTDTPSRTVASHHATPAPSPSAKHTPS